MLSSTRRRSRTTHLWSEAPAVIHHLHRLGKVCSLHILLLIQVGPSILSIVCTIDAKVSPNSWTLLKSFLWYWHYVQIHEQSTTQMFFLPKAHAAQYSLRVPVSHFRMLTRNQSYHVHRKHSCCFSHPLPFATHAAQGFSDTH